jgi:hypothetical protein
MFLAVPAVATATVVWRHWLQWRSDDGAVDGAPPREPAQAPH